MGTVKHFEEFKIWQDARLLVKDIYKLTSMIKDYGYNDQLQRAAVSIMNNITEGAESGSDIMFKKFLYIAKGSCGEVRNMLYIGSDLNYFQTEKADELIKECKYLSVGIFNLIDYLNKPKSQNKTAI